MLVYIFLNLFKSKEIFISYDKEKCYKNEEKNCQEEEEGKRRKQITPSYLYLLSNKEIVKFMVFI